MNIQYKRFTVPESDQINNEVNKIFYNLSRDQL